MELEHVKLLLVGTEKESQTLRLFPIYNPDLIRKVALHAASKSGAADGEQEPIHCVTGNITGHHESLPYDQFLDAFGLTDADVKRPAGVANTGKNKPAATQDTPVSEPPAAETPSAGG